MSGSQASLQQVVDSLTNEGLLQQDQVGQATAVANSLSGVQPWYVRTMVGFGAWLSSLLLIGFVGGIGLAAKGGFVIIGLGLMVAAVILRQRSDNDFMVQSTLATSLAGQGLLAYGIAEVTGGNDWEVVLMAAIPISTALFFLFPDRIHRVISVLIATTSLSILIFAWDLNFVVPFMGPAFAAFFVLLYKCQARIMGNGRGALVRPLMTGLMLTAFGYLMLTTIYILPEVRVDEVFYPRPWISTVLLGALFFYVGSLIWPQLSRDSNRNDSYVLYGLMLLIVIAAWANPGLLLALIVTMLGAASGNRSYIGAGIGFLVVFTGAYFYGIEISMLTKSMTLVASGVAVLLARWILLKTMQEVNTSA